MDGVADADDVDGNYVTGKRQERQYVTVTIRLKEPCLTIVVLLVVVIVVVHVVVKWVVHFALRQTREIFRFLFWGKRDIFGRTFGG